MKKILFYFPCKGLGGAERVVSVLANYFSRHGVDVLFVNDEDRKLPYYTLNDGVRSILLDQNDSNPIRKNWQRLKKIKAIVRSENPDATIAFMRLANYRLLIATMGMNVKRYVSVRANPRLMFTNGIGKLVGNMLYGTANGVVFQTEEAKTFFSAKVQKKSRIILNPVNDVFYHTEAPHDEKTILMVGRIDRNKRHDLAITAFADVAREFPDYRLKIYGQGPEEERLIQLTKDLGIMDKVQFCGIDNHIENAFSHAQVFMLTSMSEGLPNTLMEAMAMGLLVISTDCDGGGARTLIENDTQGIIVGRDSREELAQALRQLLGNEALRRTLGESARVRAEAFRTETICRQWEKYILG